MTIPTATGQTAEGTRSLLGLRGMGADELRSILRVASRLAADRSALGRTLAGRRVVNLFFEDSTRTRVSFTIAARSLGADVVQFGQGGSSLSKGETFLDTARTIEAMGVDALVVRHGSSGAALKIARNVQVPVINAGDGAHEHPTQGLLDILTLAEAHGRLDSFDLSGLTVAIVGDAMRSRVARSAIAGMTTLGAAVVCVGPASICPDEIRTLGCEVERDLDAVIGRVDAAMALRMQFERGSAIGSASGYADRYGLTPARARAMRPGAVVMHPGPMNRGLEIDSTVADGDRSVILRQVALGVPTRMAALHWCVEGGRVGGEKLG